MGQSNDSAFRMVAETVLYWILLFVFGVYIICRWTTEWLFIFLVNPVLDGLLERNDGAVVLLASGLWGVVAAVTLTPYFLKRGVLDGTDVSASKFLLGVTVAGLLYGTAIGVWIQMRWWKEAEQQMPAGYEVVELLDTPIDIQRPASIRRNDREQSRAVVLDDDLMEELVLGDGTW